MLLTLLSFRIPLEIVQARLGVCTLLSMAGTFPQATCRCKNKSLLNGIDSAICLSKKDTHWCCPMCAPKYICLQHNRRCVQSFGLWGKTVGQPLHRQCAYGCVQLCTHTKCVRRVANMPIVLQFGMKFKSYSYFVDYINNHDNRIAYVIPGLPHSLMVLQLSKKTFGKIQILSLYGLPPIHKCTFTIALSSNMFGSNLHVLLHVDQLCAPSSDNYTLLELGRQTTRVVGHSDTISAMEIMWPYCTIQIQSVHTV